MASRQRHNSQNYYLRTTTSEVAGMSCKQCWTSGAIHPSIAMQTFIYQACKPIRATHSTINTTIQWSVFSYKWGVNLHCQGWCKWCVQTSRTRCTPIMWVKVVTQSRKWIYVASRCLCVQRIEPSNSGQSLRSISSKSSATMSIESPALDWSENTGVNLESKLTVKLIVDRTVQACLQSQGKFRCKSTN